MMPPTIDHRPTARRFTRQELLAHLAARVAAGQPILCATAGNGLIARALEQGGVDLMLTSITGLARQRGLPSIAWRLNDNNAYVRQVLEELAEVTYETPFIASVGATLEAQGTDFGALVREYGALGYSGILNFPTVGEIDAPRFAETMEEFIARGAMPDAGDFDRRMGEAALAHRADLEEKIASGNDFSREVDLIRAAHEADIFTMGYAFTTQAAIDMARAGADIIVGHCGGTAGGSAGKPMITHELAAQFLNSIFAAAKSVRPDVLLMGHGGPFATPADTARLYELTDAVGFLSGSAMERIPVERAVAAAVTAFRAIPI